MTYCVHCYCVFNSAVLFCSLVIVVVHGLLGLYMHVFGIGVLNTKGGRYSEGML